MFALAPVQHAFFPLVVVEVTIHRALTTPQRTSIVDEMFGSSVAMKGYVVQNPLRHIGNQNHKIGARERISHVFRRFRARYDRKRERLFGRSTHGTKVAVAQKLVPTFAKRMRGKYQVQWDTMHSRITV